MIADQIQLWQTEGKDKYLLKHIGQNQILEGKDSKASSRASLECAFTEIANSAIGGVPPA